MSWVASLWQNRLIRSYLFDLLLIGILFLPYFLVEPLPAFERPFWRDDHTISFPYKDREIIPNWLLPFISLGIPTAILSGWMAYKRLSNRRLLVAFIGLLLALALTVEATTATKILVGRLRPDFLARCNLDPTIMDRNVCRGPTKLVREGRKSFPSGHTSSAFAGLGYAGFFLAGQLGLFDGQGYAIRLFIVGIPFGLASFVGISRIMDFRHHWQDVLAGAILGIILAYVTYRMYFPALTRAKSEEPLDGRFRSLADKEFQDDRPGTSRASSSGAGPEAV